MAGVKRKEAIATAHPEGNVKKRLRKQEKPAKISSEESYVKETATDSDPIIESETTSQSGEINGTSWPSDTNNEPDDWTGLEEDKVINGLDLAVKPKSEESKPKLSDSGTSGTTSREAHAKQKIEKQERKAAKPNADSIARSKKLWERLRRKSHVPLEERKTLIAELFEIITGRVKEFVFKHDSVRVIQTALKYANIDQRKMIASELKGEYRTLAESKYAKFLIGKLLVRGDEEIRDLIVPELYGHVRRMIKHPEASWILDDIYRGIATSSQKATMLREWYGAEYAIFKSDGKEPVSADLTDLLKKHPEKRTPMMRSLHDLINLLVQKKTTGFTMLHDAMIQYFLNVPSGSEEGTNFIELLKGDEEGDLLKNLAFTKSGARLVCLALAHGHAKDRKHIIRTFKDTMKLLAYDAHGHQVLITIYDVVDDTVLVSKSILPELVGRQPITPERERQTLEAATHLNARIPLVYPFLPSPAPAFLSPEDIKLVKEVHRIRASTSKKDPETRRRELINALSAPLLSLIQSHTTDLLSTSFGCQFIGEVLLEASGDRTAVMASIAAITSSSEETNKTISNTSHVGSMLKKLVTGGRYNKETNKVDLMEPALGFHDIFYEAIKNDILDRATGKNSFVIVALLEAAGFSHLKELKKALKKPENRERLKKVANESNGVAVEHKGAKKGKGKDGGVAAKGNRGTQLVLKILEE